MAIDATSIYRSDFQITAKHIRLIRISIEADIACPFRYVNLNVRAIGKLRLALMTGRISFPAQRLWAFPIALTGAREFCNALTISI